MRNKTRNEMRMFPLYNTHSTLTKTNTHIQHFFLLESTQTADSDHPGSLPLLIQHHFCFGEALQLLLADSRFYFVFF